MAPENHSAQSPASLLSNIQALRFYAAFAVVLFHSRKLFTALGLEGDWFLQSAKFGNAGVDVFFVISGYVMWHTTFRDPRTLASSVDFARRRLYRIYLGYWPYYFLAAVVTLWIAERDPANIHWVKSFFLLNPTIRHQVLGVAWTLSYELYFYGIFALLLLIPVARARRALVLLLAATLAVNLLWPTNTWTLSFFVSPFLLEFFAGSLLAAYLGQCKSRWLLLACLLLAVLFVAWAVTLPRFHLHRVQGFGVAAALIVLAGVLAENARLYVASRRWVLLGNCSYAIYLGHFVLLWVYMHVITQYELQFSLPGAIAVYFSYLVLVIVLSVVGYRVIEAPLYKYALKNWRFG
jgi:exopolysaccharide production protein ExoZ